MFDEEKVEDQELDGNMPAEASVEEAPAELPGDEESSEEAASVDEDPSESITYQDNK